MSMEFGANLLSMEIILAPLVVCRYQRVGRTKEEGEHWTLDTNLFINSFSVLHFDYVRNR